MILSQIHKVYGNLLIRHENLNANGLSFVRNQKKLRAICIQSWYQLP